MPNNKQNEGLIYLASPFTSEDKNLEYKRYEQVVQVLAKLTLQGYAVFSPIAHSYRAAKLLGLDGSWEFWQPVDIALLNRSDKLMVLCLEGWEDSVGVRAEIDHARERGDNGIPVEYLDFRDFE